MMGESARRAEQLLINDDDGGGVKDTTIIQKVDQRKRKSYVLLTIHIAHSKEIEKAMHVINGLTFIDILKLMH